MESGRAGGEDNRLPEMLKESDVGTKDGLEKLFNKCLF